MSRWSRPPRRTRHGAALALARAGVTLIDSGAPRRKSSAPRRRSSARAAIASRPRNATRLRARSAVPGRRSRARGQADCFVAGASRTTADVLRAALWLIGLAPGVKTVSSFFVMAVPTRGPSARARWCSPIAAWCPIPTPSQLAEIGVHGGRSLRARSPARPRTSRSCRSRRAAAPSTRASTRCARRYAHARARDGPISHSTASCRPTRRSILTWRGVRRRPARWRAKRTCWCFPISILATSATNWSSGWPARAAYGPILMGLRAQANDLSRGCSVEDVVQVSLIACTLAARGREQRPA